MSVQAVNTQSNGLYGKTGRFDRTSPRPYTLPKPPGANDNSPRPANDNFRKSVQLARLTPAGQGLVRRIPWLNYALNAWDLYRFINGENTQGQMDGSATMVVNGWTLEKDCGLTPTHYDMNSGFCNAPSPTTPCFSGSLASTARAINLPIDQNRCRLRKLAEAGNQGPPSYNKLFDAAQYWWRNSSTTPNPVGQVIARQLQRPIEPLVVIDPNTLPIGLPMNLPLPIPWALVPHRLNDPIGSQRDQGETRPRFVTPRPPGPGTKEVKLMPRSVMVAVRLMHAATEGLDFLDAVHKALPKEFQAKAYRKDGKWWNATPQDRARAIYDNLDKLNWNDAALNLLKNEVGDRILGRANAKADKALNNSPIGRITRGVAF